MMPGSPPQQSLRRRALRERSGPGLVFQDTQGLAVIDGKALLRQGIGKGLGDPAHMVVDQDGVKGEADPVDGADAGGLVFLHHFPGHGVKGQDEIRVVDVHPLASGEAGPRGGRGLRRRRGDGRGGVRGKGRRKPARPGDASAQAAGQPQDA